MFSISLTMETAQKVIRDGKVAIVHSADYGSSLFSAFSKREELLFSPALVELVESGGEITPEFIMREFGIDVSGKEWGGFAVNLQVTYLPVGTKFYISEEDGKETIITAADLTLEA
jgi:hypothetical protein